MHTGQTRTGSAYGAKIWGGGKLVCDCILNTIIWKFDSKTVYPVKNPAKCYGKNWWRDGFVDEELAEHASRVGFRFSVPHKTLEMEAHRYLSLLLGDGDMRIPGSWRACLA